MVSLRAVLLFHQALSASAAPPSISILALCRCTATLNLNFHWWRYYATCDGVACFASFHISTSHLNMRRVVSDGAP